MMVKNKICNCVVCRVYESPNRTRETQEIARSEPNQPVPNSRKGNVE